MWSVKFDGTDLRLRRGFIVPDSRRTEALFDCPFTLCKFGELTLTEKFSFLVRGFV